MGQRLAGAACSSIRTGWAALRLPLEGTFGDRRGSLQMRHEIDKDTRTVTVTAIQQRSDVYRRR